MMDGRTLPPADYAALKSMVIEHGLPLTIDALYDIAQAEGDEDAARKLAALHASLTSPPRRFDERKPGEYTAV